MSDHESSLSPSLRERPIRISDLGLAFAIWAVLTFAVGMPVAAIGAAYFKWINPALTAGDIQRIELASFWFMAISVAIVNGATLGALVLLARRYTASFKARFLKPVEARTLAIAALSSLVLFAFCFAGEVILKQAFAITLPLSPAEEAINPKTLAQWIFALAALCAFVPFFEEVLFRGLLFGWLCRKIPTAAAILISAVAFSAVHGLVFTRGGLSGWVGSAEIVLIGMLLAWWTQKTNSLWPAATVHFVNNATALTLAFLFPGLL